MTSAIETFFSAWSMDDAGERQMAITASIAEQALYADPRTDAPIAGPAALDDYVGMFSANSPGAVAEVVKSEERAGVTRATIAFKMPNGMQQLGQYFVEHDDAGLIARMIGFVGTGETT